MASLAPLLGSMSCYSVPLIFASACGLDRPWNTDQWHGAWIHTIVQQVAGVLLRAYRDSWDTRNLFDSEGMFHMAGTKVSGVDSVVCMIKAAALEAGMRFFFSASESLSLSWFTRLSFNSKIRFSIDHASFGTLKEDLHRTCGKGAGCRMSF